MIARHVFAEAPPRVKYEITEFGRSLGPVVASMQEWGREFKAWRLAEEAKCGKPGNAAVGVRAVASA